MTTTKNQNKYQKMVDPLFSPEYFDKKYSNYEENHL